MQEDTRRYNEQQEPGRREVCELLAREIDSHPPGRGEQGLAWPSGVVPGWQSHCWIQRPETGHPADVLERSRLRGSRAGVAGKKFRHAFVFYHDVSAVVKADLRRWQEKARDIQWDYRNLVRRKGRLERLE